MTSRETRAERDPPRVLMIDDNEADVRLVAEVLRLSGVGLRFESSPDGKSGLARLRDTERPRPDVVLLDLNMPGVDGFAVLSEIKSDPDLSAIPVVVFSSSEHEDDVRTSYRLHANTYIVKTYDIDRLAEVFRNLEVFWFGTARLPREH